MNNQSFKIPTIKLETRAELIEFFEKTRPLFVFEKFEEVVNPIGRQWTITITTKVETQDIGAAIVEYKENIFEYTPNDDCLVAKWLKESCPFIQNFYKGIILA